METWMPSRVRCLHDDNGNLFVLGRLFSCSSPSRAASRRLATVKTSASLAQDGRFVRNNLESKRKELKDYFEESKEMIKADGGPPRWFSPLGSGSHSHDSPLLLYLPGLVNLVQRTVRSESNRSPSRQIYIVGESLGACIALAVASCNHDVDLA